MNKLRKMLRNTSGWFRRNNTIMAQAKDLSRQLQEAWDKTDEPRNINATIAGEREYMREQLHRVARERDQERKLRLETYGVCQDAMNQIGAERRLRLAAEDALLDMYLDNEEE